MVDADGTRSLYGASVVFVDESLECSSPDLFEEFPALVDAHTVKAEQAKGQNERDNALTKQLVAALDTQPVSDAH